jgi:hypothetical protein
MTNSKETTGWKIILILSITLTIISLIAFANLQINIIGDGIPNRTQGWIPPEYPWMKAILSAITTIFFVGTAVYSLRRIKL